MAEELIHGERVLKPEFEREWILPLGYGGGCVESAGGHRSLQNVEFSESPERECMAFSFPHLNPFLYPEP